MVQYDTSPGWSNTSYWKLEPFTEEQARNAEPLTKIRSNKLERSFVTSRDSAIHSREQRNMLIYDRCTADELRGFCISRGLLNAPKPAARTASQVEALRIAYTTRLEQHDDEECTFKKLFDLPPELRLRIYESYRASLKTPPSLNAPSPVPPLITAVSRALREETMPVFCDTLVFHCHASGYGWYKPGPIQMNVRTKHFFEQTPDIFLQSLRQLQILSPVRIGIEETLAPHISPRVRWRIDLRSRTRDSRVVLESSNTFADRLRYAVTEDVKQALMQQMGVIREALRDLADTLSARSTLGLRMEDADSIMEALNAESACEGGSVSDGGFESSIEGD